MKSSARRTVPAAKQRGVMLIEALIAILIFTIGILGVIGLQAMAVQNSSDARYRAQAAVLADQLLGEMWISNRNAASLQAAFNTCSTATCASYQAWAASVASSLPGVILTGITKPDVTVDNQGAVTITVQWRAPGEENLPTAHKYVLTGQIGQ